MKQTSIMDMFHWQDWIVHRKTFPRTTNKKLWPQQQNFLAPEKFLGQAATTFKASFGLQVCHFLDVWCVETNSTFPCGRKSLKNISKILIKRILKLFPFKKVFCQNFLDNHSPKRHCVASNRTAANFTTESHQWKYTWTNPSTIP